MPQQKPFFTTIYSPIRELSFDDEEATSATGCGCFRFRLFGRHKNDEIHNNLLREGGGGGSPAWLVVKFKNLKEFSEVVAGPKWKNFVRKLGKLYNPKRSSKQTMMFQYSPESYALNFAGDEDQDDDGVLMHSFSSRFASGSNLINDQQRRTGL